VFLCGAGAAYAATFEVARSGDDANPGTAERPLKSIGKALALAGAGDTVLIHSGTYREGLLQPRASGTQDKPLVIRAATGEEVVIKGSMPVSGWQEAGNGLWKRENWTINSQQLFADGQSLQQIGAASLWHTKAEANRICLPPVGQGIADIVPGSFYYDAPARTLYCMLPDRSDPNRVLMEASTFDRILDGLERNYITLRNLTFMHSNGTASGQWSALVRLSGTGWLIEDCTFTQGDFAGLSMSGENHTVRRCRLTFNGDSGLNMNGSGPQFNYKRITDRPPQNILLEELEIRGNNTRRFYEHWHAGGMKLIPSIRSVTIRRCHVADNYGPGLWLDGALGNNIIEDNLVVNNRTGIFYEISLPAAGDAFGARIRNNRVIGSINQGIYVAASSGAIVENNTCYGNRWDIVLHGMPRNVFGGPMLLKDNIVRNNIVYGREQNMIVYSGEYSSHNIVDGNFYATTNPNPQPEGQPQVDARPLGFHAPTDAKYQQAVPFRDLQEVTARTGFERNGLSGDPLWIKPADLDFRLRPESPARGKGWQDDLY
jgi:parallel beta-helix repeat protein